MTIDTNNSAFTIKAEETIKPGLIKIARGNINPLKGKVNLITLNVTVLKSGASTSQFGYLTGDSLVMSTQNENILSDSPIVAQKPITSTSKNNTKGVLNLLSSAVKEFFNGLFGK